MSGLRRTFRLEKPLRGGIADAAHPKPQTLISRWNLLGCHGISSVNGGLGRPQTGSALHYLVTAVSVKKALMGLLQLLAARDAGRAPAGDASRTQSAKIRSGDLVSHCANGIVKE